MSQNNRKSITQFFKSETPKPYGTSIFAKIKAQMSTHDTKINDKPSILQQIMFSQNWRVEIDYVHAKHIGFKSFHGFIMMKSNFFILF